MTKAWARGWGRTRVRIYVRDQGICQLCELPIMEGQAWDVDHIVPRSQGGLHHDGNLRLAHKGCNSARGARMQQESGLPRARVSRW
jgi:5-methylcytosine-specific restriction endonuclease McrA